MRMPIGISASNGWVSSKIGENPNHPAMVDVARGGSSQAAAGLAVLTARPPAQALPNKARLLVMPACPQAEPLLGSAGGIPH